MTKEAYDQMRLVAKTSTDPRHRKNAIEIARILYQAIEDDELPLHAESEFAHSLFTYDTYTSFLTAKTGKIGLSDVEGQILSEFMRKTGKTVSMDELMDSVDIWRDGSGNPNIASARVRLLNLRNKMSKIGLTTPEFPNGFILRIHSSKHVLIDPNNPIHVKKYKSFATSHYPKQS